MKILKPLFNRNTQRKTFRQKWHDIFRAQVWGSLFVMVFGFIFALPDYFYKSWYAPTELTVIAVESRESDSGNEVYRPTFEAISPAGLRTTYRSNVSNSDDSHQIGDVVQGYVNWDKGTMRSRNQIDFSFSMGGLMVVLGGLSFLISAFIVYGPRVLAHFRGPPVR